MDLVDQANAQLFSDPGKKGTLFWEDHFSGTATKKKEKELEPLNN